MARSALTAAAIAALALTGAGCDRLQHRAADSSVTVKLPPPRPAAPAPGFKPVAGDPDGL